ncbi:hypothetical protein J6524_13680 [Bradyrhizobium sp. WSM 1738]|uniref:hypothetical protein n=1 Tax=Bradyrhizobium hereditatis TaxID=2821405 RepID=UPI001CE2511F|nr:hypothetical protein [Bradyrhizobium hereditatis]MCA6115934.1 hypothetical protein [Bradyrhizobium hereditatis]
MIGRIGLHALLCRPLQRRTAAALPIASPAGIVVAPHLISVPTMATGRLRRASPKWQAAAISVYAITETRLLPAKA